MKKTDSKLREIARTILLALDKAAADAVVTETEPAEISENIEYTDSEDINSRFNRYRALRAANMGAEADNSLAEMSVPRTTRKQYLSQRLERRETRRAGQTGDTGDDGAENGFAADPQAELLTDRGAPARLSEVYRRDARRYDSPFERY